MTKKSNKYCIIILKCNVFIEMSGFIVKIIHQSGCFIMLSVYIIESLNEKDHNNNDKEYNEETNYVILYKNIYFIKCETGKYLQMLEQNYKYCGK